jgi:hypothetical protein
MNALAAGIEVEKITQTQHAGKFLHQNYRRNAVLNLAVEGANQSARIPWGVGPANGK